MLILFTWSQAGILLYYIWVCLKYNTLDREEGYITFFTRRKTYVVFSANKNYSHLMPLTAQLWYERTGLIPCCVLIYQDNDIHDKIFQLVNSTLHIMKEKYIKEMIIVEVRLNNYNTVSISQNIRIFISLLHNFNQGDFILTTDVDVWPVNPYIWKHFSDSIKDHEVFSYNYGCCGNFLIKYKIIRHFAMHAILTSVNNWRKISEVYKYFRNSSDIDSIVNGIQKTLFKEFHYNGSIKEGYGKWYADEMLLSYFIHKTFKRNQVKGFESSCRIDKSYFPTNLTDHLHCYDSHIFSQFYMLRTDLRLFNSIQKSNITMDYVSKLLLLES